MFDRLAAGLRAGRSGFCARQLAPATCSRRRRAAAARLRYLGESLADDLGQVRQDQQQGGSKEDESGLAYFRMFEHGYLPFFVIPERQCLRQEHHALKTKRS